MEELWVDVIGFEGLYQVSNYGRVRSLDKPVNGRNFKTVVKKGRALKQVDTGLGYLQVCLRKDHKNHSLYVHRLVWESFNGPVPEGKQINHINEDKTDNRLENLNLLTPKANSNWGTRNKRILKTKTTRTYRKPNYYTRKVSMYSLDGEFEKEFESMKAAMIYLGRTGSSSNISGVCQGKLKTAYNHIWKYT